MPNSDDFENILTNHLDDMYALAIKFTGSKATAEDLVHDLFVNLSLKRYKNREIRKPKAWLTAIMYRIFVDQWRRKKNAPVQYWSNLSSVEETNLQSNLSDQQACPEQILESEKQQKRLLQALDTLNQQQQQIIVLHEIEGYTLNEISQIMEIPLGTIKSAKFRARHKLLVALNHLNGETKQDEPNDYLTEIPNNHVDNS